MLLVNLATVRRKNAWKITEEEGKTDEEPIRIEGGEQERQGPQGADK